MKDFSGDAGAIALTTLLKPWQRVRAFRTIVAGMKKEWDKQATYRLERIARTEIAQAHRQGSQRR